MMQIITHIDGLGKELREDIEGVHKRIGDHLLDCRNRHNGTNLQEMKKDIDNFKEWMLKVTGGLAVVFALITFLKDAIVAYFK